MPSHLEQTFSHHSGEEDQLHGQHHNFLPSVPVTLLCVPVDQTMRSRSERPGFRALYLLVIEVVNLHIATCIVLEPRELVPDDLVLLTSRSRI